MAKGKKRTSKSKRPASKKRARASTAPSPIEPTAEPKSAVGLEQPESGPEPKTDGYASKTHFIADHLHLLPKAGVKLAKEKYDLDITPDYFSQTKHRLKGKKKAGAKKKATGNGRSNANSAGAKRARSVSIRSSVEAQFTSLLKRIGIDRASEILEAYKAE